MLSNLLEFNYKEAVTSIAEFYFVSNANNSSNRYRTQKGSLRIGD